MLTSILRPRLVVLCLVIAALIPFDAEGQTTVGVQPFGTYQSNQIDTISMFDLGVHITIPLYTHKARGRNMGLSVELRYNSLTANVDPLMGAGFNLGPWQIVSRTASGGTVIVSTPYGGDCSGMGSDGNYHDGTFTAYTYSFLDESGYAHPYAGTSIDAQNCASGWSSTSLDEYPADGSGYHLSGNGSSATVTDPAGTKYQGGSGYITITDSNGNVGSPTSSGWAGGVDNSNVSITATGGLYNFDQNGQPSSRNPLVLHYTDPSGGPQTITINFQTYTVVSSPTFMVDSVVYSADGSSYHFTYQPNPYAAGYLSSLASIQLPTGGVINYSYSNGAAPPSAWAFNTLTRTTSDGSTSYNRTVNQTNPMQTTTDIGYVDGSQSINFVYLQVVGSDNLNYGPARALETKHVWKDASSSIIKSTMKCYNGATGDCTTAAVYMPLVQLSTVTTLDSGQASKLVEFYSASSLPLETDEYDYGASTPTRKTITTYANLGNYISNRPQSVTVQDGNGTQIASTTYGYDEASTSTPSSPLSGLVTVSGARGNQTSKHLWLNTTGGTLNKTRTYDDAGRMLSENDPRQNGDNSTMHYGYDSQSCLTTVTPPTPSNGISKATSATCDQYNVLPKTSTDANGTVTYYYYNGMLDESEVVVMDSGGTKVADTVYSYPNPNTKTTTMYRSASVTLQSSEVVDGLGRISTKTGVNGAIVATTYDSMGRVQSVTNPYVSTGDATYGITSYLYDALGRTRYQCQPDDGGTNTSTCNHTSSYKSWTYNGNTTTFRDEAGKQWKHTSDALGRLTSVAEDPSSWNYITNYTYDTLNNLTRVDQWGAPSNNSGNRVRTFTYDSLSRLLSANNPESGTTSYTYFSPGTTLCSGNPSLPCTKTNGNNVTTSYHYDELNRMVQQTSSSRNYAYAYDQAVISNCGGLTGTFPVGRLTYVSNNVNAAEFFVYNALGQLTRQTNWTPSNGSSTANPVCAIRDWIGNVTQLTYPDGRVVNQQFDGGGNLTTVSYDNWNGQSVGYNYMSNGTYWPNGAPSQFTNDNGLTTTWYVNKRMQPTEAIVTGAGGTKLVDRQYCYGASAVSGANCTPQSIGDNGNIYQINDTLGSSNTQNFAYDNLNRLYLFSNGSGSMQQSYSIDPWGNSVQSGTISSGTNFAGAATNRDTSGTTSYDNAGNTMSYNNGVATHYYAYDEEGEITNIDSGYATYTYDASGNRVRKDSGGAWTEYIDFGGLTVAEKNSDGSWSDNIFANGKRIARSDSFDERIHIEGNSNAAGSAAGWYLPFSQYVIQYGDKISWRQYQNSAVGGIGISFSDGTNTNWTTYDTSGQLMNSDSTQNSWHFRTVDLSAYAGKTAVNLWIAADAATPVGFWYSWFADIALYSSNGNVIPIYYRQASTSLSYFHFGSESNTQAFVERGNTAADAESPWNTTTFYSSDQIGSTRMLSSGGGWPVSSDTYYPFGQEAFSSGSNDPYKFSGKERDTESGLDYFGARYYVSGIGRFMSADWSAQAQPVPYAKLEDPQTLNLYAYVRNNPISLVDPNGHWVRPDGGCCFSLFYSDSDTSTDLGANERKKAEEDEKEQKGPRKLSFWNHVGNLLHGHSWNFMRESGVGTIKEWSEVREKPESDPVLTAVSDGLNLASKVIPGAKRYGEVATGISAVNNPDMFDGVLIGAAFIPVMGEAVDTLGLVIDGGKFVLTPIVNRVGKDLYNASPSPTIDDGNGRSIRNPAFLERDEYGGVEY